LAKKVEIFEIFFAQKKNFEKIKFHQKIKKKVGKKSFNKTKIQLSRKKLVKKS